MSDPLAELLARVKSGAPLAAILDEYLPDDEREALDRCAALRTFDRETFAVACHDLPGDARDTFEAITAHPDVRGLGDGRYRVRSSARRRRLDRWLAHADDAPDEIPSWLQELSKRLVEHYDAPETRDELEALYHAFGANLPEARNRLAQQFAAAERAFDLAGCQNLIDVAEERRQLGGRKLGEELIRLRARLQARVQWAGAWYRTASFVPPATSRGAIERLLAPGEPRGLEIVGREGMGSTSHLQWLIARCAVPQGIACARLDLNDIGEPALAAQEPWLLLLEIARQLDPQLPGTPFEPLLLRFEAHSVRLQWLSADPARARDVAARAPESALDRRRLGEAVREGFFDALHGLPEPRRVLIVADSVHPVLAPDIGRTGDPRVKAVLGELSRVVANVPSALVVLASRRPPRRGAPRLGGGIETLRLMLAPLSDDEARRYLRGGARRALAPELEAAAVRAGRGVPMRLAVLADVLRRRPGVTAAQLGALRDADELGLTEPILAELPDALQAALRYGAAPVVLDADLFARVLVPFVGELLGTEVDGTALWRGVRDFAALSPWVELAGPDAVRFHMMFKRPIRERLRETPEMREFNERADSYFRARADAEPDRWGYFASQALVHEFLHAGTDTVASWRELMRSARQRDARHAERLAYELLRLASLDRDGRPNELAAVATEAWVALGWAAVRAAREAPGRPRGHDGWQRAAVALEELAARADSTPPPPAQIAGLKAALLGRDGESQAAVRLLRDALPGARAPQDRLTLHAELGRALEQASPDEAALEYRRARRIAARLPLASPDVATVDRRLARHLMSRDRYRAAMARCAATLEDIGEGGRVRAELEQLRAEILLRSGAPSAAAVIADQLAECDAAGARGRHRARRLSAWTAIATWRPEEAAARLTRMLDTVAADDSGAPGIEIELRMAQLRELRAQARLRLLDAVGGLDDLDCAAASFDQAGLAGRLRNCIAAAAELQMRHLGDMRAAGLTLDRLDVAASVAEPSDALAGELRRVEWLDGTQQSDGLHERLAELTRGLRARSAAPHSFIAVAIAGLALTGDPRPRGYLELLVEQLGRVETVGARLLLLEDLRRCGRVADPDDPAARALDRLTGPPPGLAALPPRDRGMLLLTHSDVARICGRQQAAQARMQQAHEAITSEPLEPYGQRRLLEARERFALPPEPREPEALTAPQQQLAAHPSSGAALLIKEAFQALRTGAAAEPLIAAAEQLLARGQADGKWLAALHKAREQLAARSGDEPVAQRHRVRAALIEYRLDEHAVALPATAAHAEAESPRLELRRRPAGLGVRLAGAPHAEEHVVGGSLGRMLAKPDEASVADVVRWVAGGTADFADEAAAALFPDPVRAELARRGERELTLLLSSRDRRAHALPWELALAAAPAPLASIERTAPAVAAVPGPPPASDRRVTIFSPPPGPDAHASWPLADRYRTAGWDVRVEHGFTPAALERSVSARAPAVVHFACPLLFFGGTAMLDAGAEGGRTLPRQPEAELLTASRLARAALPIDAATLFVIDPPGVAGVQETARQLLLRNVLAAELLLLVARPVLCTGAVGGLAREAVANAVVSGLTEALDLRPIARHLQARAELGAGDLRGALGVPALFTAPVPATPSA